MLLTFFIFVYSSAFAGITTNQLADVFGGVDAFNNLPTIPEAALSGVLANPNMMSVPVMRMRTVDGYDVIVFGLRITELETFVAGGHNPTVLILRRKNDSGDGAAAAVADNWDIFVDGKAEIKKRARDADDANAANPGERSEG